MSTDKERNAPSPDRFMERDVNDLRVTVGRFEERISNIKENMVTKDQLTEGLSAAKLQTTEISANNKVEAWKTKAEIWKAALTLVVTLLAAAVGAFALMLTGLVRVALGS